MVTDDNNIMAGVLSFQSPLYLTLYHYLNSAASAAELNSHLIAEEL